MPERDWQKDWEMVMRVAATAPSLDDDFIKQIGEVLLALHYWLYQVHELEERLATATEALKEIMDDTEDCRPYVPREHLWRVIKSTYMIAKIALQNLNGNREVESNA